MSYAWPIMLVVVSNTLYQICTKSLPSGMNPFASLTVTYSVAAVASAILFVVFSRGGNIIAEYKKINFAPIVLGIVIIGLEVGFIFAYRAGWQVSKAAIVQSSALAVALIFVGRFALGEGITWNKLVGVAVCIVGIVFINLK